MGVPEVSDKNSNATLTQNKIPAKRAVKKEDKRNANGCNARFSVKSDRFRYKRLDMKR